MRTIRGSMRADPDCNDRLRPIVTTTSAVHLFPWRSSQMRNILLAVAGLVLVTAAVSAQTKKASDDFTFSSDVRVGTQVLKAGDYHFVCDTKGVTISRVTVRTEGDVYLTKVHTSQSASRVARQSSSAFS